MFYTYSSVLESKEIEFKEEVPKDSQKYTKTVVAFANSNGGQIIFGVEDKSHRIVGLKDCDLFVEADRISNAIADSILPSVSFSIDIKEVEGLFLLVLNVLPGDSKPYRIKALSMEDGIFVRMGGTTRISDRETSSELFFANRNSSWDCQIYQNREFSKADIKLLKEKVSEEINVAKMRSWNLIKEKDGKTYITNAFALLTGQFDGSPSIQCAVFRGTDKSQFLDKKEFEGPLLENYKDVVKFLFANTRTSAKINGFERVETQDIPDTILRELAINAIVHRSYINYQSSFVGIFSDRIEIITPGVLLPGLTIEKMKEGFSVIRNKAIAKVFMDSKLMEGWGSGIPRIIKTAKIAGLKIPKIEDLGTGLKITVYRRTLDEERTLLDLSEGLSVKESTPIYLSSNQGSDAVLSLIEINKNITQAEISKRLNLSLSTVKRICLRLQQEGKITRVGNNRAGFWQIKL